jgi:hypothetical protein
MHPVGLYNRRYIMSDIKDYNTNLITMDAELFKQIKILAAQLNKDQNNLLEEATQDLIKKYKDQDRQEPSFTGEPPRV